MRPPLSLLVVVALVGGGLGAATALPAAPAPGPASAIAPEPPPPPAPLAATTLVCPSVRRAGPDLRTAVVAAVPPLAGAGVVRTAVPGRPYGDAVLTTAGQAARLTEGTADGEPLLVGTRGPLAPGLVAEQVTRGETAADRGWSAVRCTAPTASAWYAGVTGVPGSTSELLLTNPGRSAALVDLLILGPSGRLVPPGATGIVVGPGRRAVVGLDALLAGSGPAAVRVDVRGGRVASAVRVRRVAGTASQGVDWVPASEAPAEDLLLPGLPGGDARRTLVVANPGAADVTVRVALVGLGGTAIVRGLRALPVPAGTTVEAAVPPGAEPAALRLQTTGGPVVAALEVDEGDATTGIRETAYAAPAPALGPAAVVGEVVSGATTTTTLVLTATTAPASVLVRALPVEGRPRPAVSPRRVEIAAGTTQSLSLSAFYGDREPGPVLLAVEGGPVWAGRVLREEGRRGPLLTLLDVRTPPATVPGVAVVARPGLLDD